MTALGKLAGAGLGLVLLQVLLASALPSAIRPDLVLVFALALGLRSPGTLGLFLAFALGFAVDVLSGSPPGLFALLRGTACVASRVLDRALYLRAPGPWVAYVVGYAIVDALLMGLALHIFMPESALGWGTVLGRLPGQLVMMAIVSAPLLLLFLHLDVATEPVGRPAGLGVIERRL